LIISSSFLPKAEHFTFQTKWMADRLVARDKNGQLYNGGLLSDVTYRFFENGYLLTTSMFCDDLQRWIPVQLTWIRGLSDEYYKIHFTVLFQQLFKHTMTMIEREGLASQVVDFSAAQANGFIQAYCEVFREPDAAVARNLLKGCREHYRQSITRVKRNRAVITADEEVCCIVCFFIFPCLLSTDSITTLSGAFSKGLHGPTHSSCCKWADP
jgi:hypothetical protein